MFSYSSSARQYHPIQISEDIRAKTNSDGSILKMPIDSQTRLDEFANTIYFAHKRDFQITAKLKEKTGPSGEILKKGTLIVGAVPSRFMPEIANLAAVRNDVRTLFSIMARKNGFENLLKDIKTDELFNGNRMAPSFKAWEVINEGIKQQKIAESASQLPQNKKAAVSEIPENAC